MVLFYLINKTTIQLVEQSIKTSRTKPTLSRTPATTADYYKTLRKPINNSFLQS